MSHKTRRKSKKRSRPPKKRDDSGISSLESLSWCLPRGSGECTSTDEYTGDEESETTRDSVFGSPGASILPALSVSSSLADGKTTPLLNGRLHSTPLFSSQQLKPKQPTSTTEKSEGQPKEATKSQSIVYLSNHCEEILKKLSKDPRPRQCPEESLPKHVAPKIFTQFQSRVGRLLELTVHREPDQRQALYQTLTFLGVFDELCLSVSTIRALVDSVLELVECTPELSLVCAEYCKVQVDSAGPDWKSFILEAILRSIRFHYLQRGSTLPRDEVRRLRYAYTTLLGHFYVVRLLPSGILYNYIAEMIQPGRDETEIDSLTYAVRLLSIVGWVWDAESEDHQIQLSAWYCLLARIVNCPPPLKFDVQRLLAQRPMACWRFGSYHRAPDFETRQWLDDVVFRTRNSFGRGLHASKELLAMYSPYFHKFFGSSTRRHEQHEVFIGVEFFVFREILSILYSVKRVFTAAHHCSYDTLTLVQLYYAAKQLDIPLVRRMCKEQLEEKPPLEAALVAQSLGMEEIVSIALRWMCPRDMRLFLEHGNPEATLNARDVFFAVRKVVPLKFRKLKPPTKPIPRAKEVMFPADFLTPWPLSDVILKTWYSDGKALYANSTVLCLYSHSFARNMEKRRLSQDARAMELAVDVEFDVMLAILKTIHHVDRKFSFGDHLVHGRTMLLSMLKAAHLLEMPMITRLCEDQILSLSKGDHFAIAQMAGVSDEILRDCSCPERLMEVIRTTVAAGGRRAA